MILDRAALLKLGAASAAASAIPQSLRFPQPHPRWRIVFVNHALTNPFFVPAKNGSADAASLLGVRVEWTGSTLERRGGDGEGDEARDRHARRRDRAVVHRPDRVRRPDPRRARPRDPGDRLQRRRWQAEPASRLHRTGQLPIRSRDGSEDRQSRVERPGVPVHRDAEPAEHPAPHRRGARRDPRLGQAGQGACGGEWRRRRDRAEDDRGELPGEQACAGALCRRRWFDRRASPR